MFEGASTAAGLGEWVVVVVLL